MRQPSSDSMHTLGLQAVENTDVLQFVLVVRLQQQHPCFGAACRLAKRWLGAQLFSDDITEDTADLLVAYLFLQPAPFTPPGYLFQRHEPFVCIALPLFVFFPPLAMSVTWVFLLFSSVLLRWASSASFICSRPLTGGATRWSSTSTSSLQASTLTHPRAKQTVAWPLSIYTSDILSHPARRRCCVVIVVRLSSRVAADYTEIKNDFMASREFLPVMFIATPKDKNVSMWTKQAPTVQVSGATNKKVEPALYSYKLFI